ncbi:MAG: hypothetical protein AB7G25_09155 [Sphingomonadaceae bacterium]
MGKVVSFGKSGAVQTSPEIQRTIAIGGVYRVSILWGRDPGDEPHGGDFPTHTAAYGYASGLRMVKGWKIFDGTDRGEAA